MDSFSKLRPVVQAYVSAVVAVGVLVLGLSVHSLTVAPIGSEWLILAGLTVLTGSFSVKVPSINAYISVSEAFVFASVLLFGAEAGTVTVLLECLVIVLWMKPQGRPLYRMLFNLAAPAVSIWLAGHCFYFLSGIRPYSEVFTPLPQLFVPLLAFTAAYFLLNSTLVAVAVGLETQRSPTQIWWTNFAWLSVNYFSGASLAALIVTYTQKLEFSTLAVIVPLLVVSYLTFRTAMGRAEDSYNHLSQLNRLYLSTIETLAMAIDAKDQVTHGHIRRVQTYAVGLAKHVGVTDDNLLKAIEAAALLHDMGKLAVPEHILNKPGKLTPAEFEKMKLHAGIGADILSAIDFPYPVVPIVRHHHENWDGTGYPDGIRGTDIPIGARILSVVDCFDALTSDRPYRPRLSDDDALAILRERRGVMYDPLVVDTFVRVYKTIGPGELEPADVHAGAIRDIANATAPDSAAFVSAHSSHPANFADVGELLLTQVAETIPFKLGIVFQYDKNTDQLSVGAAKGVNASTVRDLRIARGEKLSGWVAANGRSIVNSDPQLDLHTCGFSAANGLAFTLSVPVIDGSDLAAVVSLYGDEAFSEEHREHLEKSVHSRHANSSVTCTGAGAVVDLPDHRGSLEGPAHVSAVIRVEVLNWDEAGQVANGRLLAQRFVELCEEMRRALSAAALVVRTRDHELIALMPRVNAQELRRASVVIRHIAAASHIGTPEGFRLELAVDTFLAPADAGIIWDILSTEGSHLPAVFGASAKVH